MATKNTKKKVALLPDDTDFIRGKSTSQQKAKLDEHAVFKDNIFKEDHEDEAVIVPKSKDNSKDGPKFGKPLDEISYKKLSPGMLVLAVISEIGELDVVVNLPFGLTGFISGTEVSNEFNRMLEGNKEDDESYQELDLCDVLSVGQYVLCGVLSVTEVSKTKKVNLTIKPEVINCNVKMTDLKKNMVLQGIVQSEEDYGYIINTGISGVQAFLPKTEAPPPPDANTEAPPPPDANSAAPLTPLKTCDMVQIVVKSVTEGNIQCAKYDVRMKPLSEKCLTTFTSLLPGHVIRAHVKKHVVNGIRCSFLSGMQGAIHMIHLSDAITSSKTLQEVYPVKRKVTARVILVNPATKTVLLSTLPGHVTMETPSYHVNKGDTLDEVEVVKVTKRGVFVEVAPGVLGFVHMSKLLDKEVEKIPANFKMGTLHKARVMGFRLADNLVQLSLRSSDLSKPFLSYHDIEVGRVTSATVLSVEHFGLVVKLADNIRGVVPKIHLADINIKHPELKFKQNQKVKAKVLSVDPVKRRLNLTLKRSLIRNSTADVKSYESLEKNQHVTGWVAAIKNFGIIMNFTNKLRGLVHCSDISNVPISAADIGKLYKMGQVLTCRVCNVEADKEKLSLSFNLLETSSNTTSKNTNWARKWQIHSCTVLENKTEGLTVELDATKEEAFLPVYHLSDNKSLNQRKLLHLKAGSKLSDVLVIDKKMKKIILSAKPSIISWAKSFEDPPKITDFKVGDFVPGFIKDFQDYGCFVELGNSLVGLCPKACLADSFVSDPRAVFSLGDTVCCKITNIDSEKERFLVSLKMSDVRSDVTLTGTALLTSYFIEVEEIFRSGGDHLPPGTVVSNCQITRCTDQGYSISVKVGEEVDDSDVTPGFVPRDSADTADVTMQCDDVTMTTMKSGDTVRGVVLDYDPIQGLYIVNTKKEFVRVLEEGGRKRKKLTEGQEVEGSVVAVMECYFVVMLPDQGYRFGFAPRTNHINDTSNGNKDVKCNDSQTFTVCRAKKGKPLLLAFKQEKIDEKSNRKRKRSEEQEVKFDDIKLGEVYTVTVKSVKALQLNVQLARKVQGRVHITEVTDTPTTGTTPLSDFKHGDSLQATLIGFRHSKTYRYLPITRTDYMRSMGEFSLRSNPAVKEILDGEKVDEAKDLISTLNVGDSVTGFVRSVDHNGFVWISVSPGVEGRLWHLLTSSDKVELGKWQERFNVGDCLTATVFSTRDNRLDLSLVGPLEVDSKLWCKVSGVLPGIGVKVQVSARDWGIVPMTEISDTYTKDALSKFKEDTLVHCVVVEIPTPGGSSRRLTLSLRKSRISQRWKKNVGGKKVVHPVINSSEELDIDSVYSGYVKSTSATAGIYVALGHNITGRVLLKNMSDQFLKNWEPMFPLGKLVRVYVLQNTPKVELSMKLSDLKKGTKREEASEEDVQKCLDDILMEQFQNSDDDDDDVMMKSDDEKDGVSEDESVGEVEDLPRIVFSSGKNNGDAVGVIRDSMVVVETPASDSDSYEENVNEEVTETDEKRGKSFEKREKRRKKDAEEQAIRQIETKKTTSLPETEDEFEREVARAPDSSSNWVCYMAYWLGLSNVDKARLTAKRALDTINYRLEGEKLNIWSALFNLENSFGTHDSLMKCCQGAAAVNDGKAVFLRLAAVLEKSGKFQELEEIYSSVLLKKYKRSRKVWNSYSTSLALQGSLEKMRETLPRALKTLSKHKHIRTICHYAQLEYKHGDCNKGSTMFENVLNSYPGRLDLWALYIDRTIAMGDIDQSRLLLERAVSLKLPAKKMKFFFKRYIEFETKFGDESLLQNIKDKARDFLVSSEANEDA